MVTSTTFERLVVGTAVEGARVCLRGRFFPRRIPATFLLRLSLGGLPMTTAGFPCMVLSAGEFFLEKKEAGTNTRSVKSITHLCYRLVHPRPHSIT